MFIHHTKVLGRFELKFWAKKFEELREIVQLKYKVI